MSYHAKDRSTKPDLVSSLVNSQYYDMKKSNSIKLDKSSSFSLMHVNIASLNAHIDDLRNVLILPELLGRHNSAERYIL